MSSIKSCGALPSMVHPTLCAVPKTSLIVPDNSRAMERGLIWRAIATMSSKVILPLCLTRKQQWFMASHITIYSSYYEALHQILFELHLRNYQFHKCSIFKNILDKNQDRHNISINFHSTYWGTL